MNIDVNTIAQGFAVTVLGSLISLGVWVVRSIIEMKKDIDAAHDAIRRMRNG